MSSIDYSKSSYAAIQACPVSAVRARNIVQLLVVVLGAASLAACAESTAVRNSNVVSPSRQASLPHDRTASFVAKRRVASVRRHTPFARHHYATPAQVASRGIASFYTEDQQTASG
jgi:rare lipoprotein A